MDSEKRPKFRNTQIDSRTLRSLVRNTAPFLSELDRNHPGFGFLEILMRPEGGTENDSDLWDYFQLCLASHFATVGTFVPTDVDLSIRQKLWSHVHHEQAFDPMWKAVQDFHGWDESPVSRRWVTVSGFGSGSGKKLSGHQGEWFSIAMGAYGCALKVAPERLAEIREAIETQVREHEVALTELRDELLSEPDAEKTKRYLAGVAAVAHNLGDLDRMFEAWKIADTDVLKRRVFRSGHEDARQCRSIFLEAGQVYQALLATENHRHFALREPKGLRKASEFLLDFGPFLDEWGGRLVKGFEAGVLTELDLREIIEALVLGWKKLNSKSIYASQGYARALYGIGSGLGGASGFAKGRDELENLVPPVIRKELKEGGLRTLFTVSRSQFEQQWMRKTLSLLRSPS